MAGGTTLPIDVQVVNFTFPGGASAAAAVATLLPNSVVISAVDLTRTYNFVSAYNSGSYRCNGIFPFEPQMAGSSCSGQAKIPAGGPNVSRQGDINDGQLSQWRQVLTSPTTARAERFGTPTPLARAPELACEHFFHHKIVEYL